MYNFSGVAFFSVPKEKSSIAPNPINDKVVVDEPSIVALERNTGKVIAVGGCYATHNVGGRSGGMGGWCSG